MQTERLTLRAWGLADAERLFDIRSREAVAKWLGDPTVWTDVATAHEHISQWQLKNRQEPVLGHWAVVRTDTDELVGAVHLSQLPDSPDVEIGWYLHPDCTGQGFATEAAAPVLARAVAGEVSRVWAIMWPHNDASAEVALRLGMIDHGVVNDPWYGTAEEPTSRMLSVPG